MYERIRVPFEPPRKCESSGKVFKLTCEGKDDIRLPVSQTELEVNEQELVIAATMPRFIAEDRGLMDDAHSLVETATAETMTREDWFLLVLTAAMVIRGESDPSWEAKKLVIQILNERSVL